MRLYPRQLRASGGVNVHVPAVVAVAEALRREFVVSIDAHPGGEGNEAGIVNRAFRAAVRVILGNVVSPGDDPDAVLTWVLRQAAVRRLTKLGVEVERGTRLIDPEPKLGGRSLCLNRLSTGRFGRTMAPRVGTNSVPKLQIGPRRGRRRATWPNALA